MWQSDTYFNEGTLFIMHFYEGLYSLVFFGVCFFWDTRFESVNQRIPFSCFSIFQAVSPSEKNVIDKIIDIGPQLAGTCDYYIVHSKYRIPSDISTQGAYINHLGERAKNTNRKVYCEECKAGDVTKVLHKTVRQLGCPIARGNQLLVLATMIYRRVAQPGKFKSYVSLH